MLDWKLNRYNDINYLYLVFVFFFHQFLQKKKHSEKEHSLLIKVPLKMELSMFTVAECFLLARIGQEKQV